VFDNSYRFRSLILRSYFAIIIYWKPTLLISHMPATTGAEQCSRLQAVGVSITHVGKAKRLLSSIFTTY